IIVQDYPAVGSLAGLFTGMSTFQTSYVHFAGSKTKFLHKLYIIKSLFLQTMHRTGGVEEWVYLMRSTNGEIQDTKITFRI
ncbi:hypothetical protein, partial [Escherichia coli]|uniref:hypothetical protein n=1 Tax=Escherichia coli TaxID=562 RepID=UPI003D34CDAE